MGRVPVPVCTLQKRQDRRVSRYKSALLCSADAMQGYEPRRLYNVAEFLMNDKDGNGNVSVEEVMQILFLRYGRQLLDSVRHALLLFTSER